MEIICTTCLSAHRKLYKLEELQLLYKLLIPDSEFKLPEVKICWECRSLLRKCSQFQRNALKARDVLVSYSLDPHCIDEQDLLSLSHSTLCATLQTKCDYVFLHRGPTYLESGTSRASVKQDPDKEHCRPVKEEIDVVEHPLSDYEDASPSPLTDDPLCETLERVFVEPGVKHENVELASLQSFKVVPPTQFVKIVKDLTVAGPSNGKIIKLTKLTPQQITLLKSKQALNLKAVGKIVGPTLETGATAKRNVLKPVAKLGPTLGAVKKKVMKRNGEGKKSLVETLEELKATKENRRLKEVKNKMEDDALPTSTQIYEWFSTALGEEANKNFEVIVMSEQELAVRREEMAREPQYVNSQFKCTDCIVGYYTEQQLADHRKAKHTEKPEQARARAHGQPVHRQCITCRAYIPADRLPFHHGRHRALLRCRRCAAVFKDVGPARSHYRQRHVLRERGFGCIVCGRRFSSRHRLTRHRECHQPAQTHYTCETCGKGFATRWSLDYHVKRHTASAEPVKCDVCQKVYKNRYTLASHLKNVHERDPSVRFRCAPCALSFVSENCLNAHLRSARAHLDPARFKHICHACGKGFVFERDLRDHHNYVHKGQTDHVCSHCNKMFSTAGGLRKHVKFVHEGKRYLKNKKCDICGRAFTSPKTLREHMNIHSGTRPFKCPVCGDTFKQSAALYNHRRLVHLGYKMRNKKVVKVNDVVTTAPGEDARP